MADSILDLDPESFAFALDELNLPADQRSYLEQQYFEQQRLLSMTPRTEGRRIGSVLPVSWPEGMTGYEALTSGDWEWDVPELVRGLYEAPAEAMNVGSAMLRGVPVTKQQMADTATTVGGLVVGSGVMNRGRGVPPAARSPEPTPAPEPTWEEFMASFEDDIAEQVERTRLRNEALYGAGDPDDPGTPGYIPPGNQFQTGTDLGPTLDEMAPADPQGLPDGNTSVPTSPWLRPLVRKQEGVASLYSPTRKAVDLLDRQQYDDIDSLREQLRNRGAKPDEVERVIERVKTEKGPISRDALARAADDQAAELHVRRVNATNTPYGPQNSFVTRYFVDGVEDQQANVFELPVANKPDFSESHFESSSVDTAPVLHTRTGMLSTAGANKPDSYHLGEIQSDWAQKRAKLFKDDADAAAGAEKLATLDRQTDQAYRDLFQKEQEIISDGNRGYYTDPEWRVMNERYSSLEQERMRAAERMADHRTYGTRKQFDVDYPAPYVGTTSKWVQLGLRQALVDAVNSGARQMSLSTGEMVKGYTYGSLKGQQKFYDDIVPKELNEVLRKFSNEAGIKKPEIVMDTVYGNGGQRYTVPVVKFTDEFVDAIKRNGLPAFAKGGVVKGSSLDFDLFEPSL